MPQQTSLGWSGVAIATIFIVLISSLILYPNVTSENVLTSLRFSSVTTALPFLLVFVAKPLRVLNVFSNLGQWAQANRRYLWLILTISHLLHLYQIFLYYQLGSSCSWLVWAITSPLWVIMVLFSAVAIFKPQLFDQLPQANGTKGLNLIYEIGNWYIWLVFTLAFGLGSVAKHIPFYNVPAFILFLAGAIAYAMAWFRRIKPA